VKTIARTSVTTRRSCAQRRAGWASSRRMCWP